MTAELKNIDEQDQETINNAQQKAHKIIELNEQNNHKTDQSNEDRRNSDVLKRKVVEYKGKCKLLNDKLVKAVQDKVMIVYRLKELGFDLSLLESPVRE